MIKVIALTRKNWTSFSRALQELESIAEYPYGADHFRIDHGQSYFGFFERLGEPLFHVAVDKERVVACAAGVLREILDHNSNLIRTWYLCDLKVHPEYRNRRLPALLFRKDILFNYLRCQRAYAVSMNPPGKPNRVVEIIRRLPYVPVSLMAELNIYSLTYEQVTLISPGLRKQVGEISYLSLAGKKDLVMKSSGEPMRLLHLQYGAFAKPQLKEPRQSFLHMICAPKDSSLDLLLNASFPAAATASVVAHRMSKVDWGFIRTSDI